MAANDRELDRQLHRFAGSLTSSDVYISYTASYTWISNQTAHIGLGLILTGIAIAFFPRLGVWPWLILPLVLYPFKELVDVIRTLRAPQTAFAIGKDELALDTAADVSFVTVGISAALLLPAGRWGAVVVLLLAAAALGYFVPKFLPVKRAFDKSALPYFFRLANFAAEFSEPDIRAIHSLIQGVNGDRAAPAHLVLFGPARSGRTSLAAGIGSELTARSERVRYIGWNRFLEGESAVDVSPPDQPWQISECRLLVVDDVKGAVPLPVRPEHVRCSVWVAGERSLAQQLAQAIQSQWLGADEQVHLIDVQSLAYKPRTGAGDAHRYVN